MKRQIINVVINKLEQELNRQQHANKRTNDGARFNAANAEKQRDTTGYEAAHLARGYAMQHRELAQQIDALKSMEIEDFTGQEVDIGALVEVEINGETSLYFLLNCGGGTEVKIDNKTVTVVTPDSPVGKALMENFDCGFFSFRSGMEGIILEVR
ncbi:hypothetical protein ACFLQY_02990 [Verrucomicrobiota bacterium]